MNTAFRVGQIEPFGVVGDGFHHQVTIGLEVNCGGVFFAEKLESGAGFGMRLSFAFCVEREANIGTVNIGALCVGFDVEKD